MENTKKNGISGSRQTRMTGWVGGAYRQQAGHAYTPCTLVRWVGRLGEAVLAI